MTRVRQFSLAASVALCVTGIGWRGSDKNPNPAKTVAAEATYSGVGIVLSIGKKADSIPEIFRVASGSPAASDRRIVVGERLTAIYEGTPNDLETNRVKPELYETKGKPLGEIVSKIRGLPGTWVTLRLELPGEYPAGSPPRFDCSLRRASLKIPNRDSGATTNEYTGSWTVETMTNLANGMVTNEIIEINGVPVK